MKRNHTGHRVGESHQNAKKLDEVVNYARAMHQTGYGYKRIGKLLNIPVSTVRDWITYRTRW